MAEQESIVDTIKQLKRKDPIQPFVIVMTSGDRYQVDDPDGLAVGDSQLHYYPPKSGRGTHLRINQVAAVEETQGAEA